MIDGSRGTAAEGHNSSHRQREHAQALHRFQPDNVQALMLVSFFLENKAR